MQYLEVNKNVFFKCSYHGKYNQTERAILMVNDANLSQGSYHWENRPWQSFDFDIAMNKAFDNSKNRLSKHHQRIIKKWLDNGGKRETKRVNDQFKSVAMVASLGAIFGSNQTEANDWKARMLKAGMPELDMPDDWDSLPEGDKQERLDKVIALFAEGAQ